MTERWNCASTRTTHHDDSVVDPVTPTSRWQNERVPLAYRAGIR